MKKLIIILFATVGMGAPLLLIAGTILMSVNHLPWEENHSKTSYGYVDFLVSSWSVFPHAHGYRLSIINEGKKETILEVNTAPSDRSAEFAITWVTNASFFARFGDFYLRIDEQGDVEVFDWQTSKRDHFIGYFQWILETQSFWECDSVAMGMYGWWKDEKARDFLERIVTEDPDSDFFPRDTTDDYWWNNRKKWIAESLGIPNPHEEESLQENLTTNSENHG